ncbi:hypothetical protein M5689_002955 [Euphorbia peplus]|nr:hypothetical protein M5689_002955 [Euphorbia peplus]
MIYSLGPGKFYGSSLPRPRIYTNVKFNFERLRFQDKIEGNIKKLSKQREKRAKDRAIDSPKSYCGRRGS